MNVHQVVHITLWFISSRLKSIIDSIVWCQVTIINVTILPILAIIKCDITLKILSKHYIIIWPINKLFLFIVYTSYFLTVYKLLLLFTANTSHLCQSCWKCRRVFIYQKGTNNPSSSFQVISVICFSYFQGTFLKHKGFLFLFWYSFAIFTLWLIGHYKCLSVNIIKSADNKISMLYFANANPLKFGYLFSIYSIYFDIDYSVFRWFVSWHWFIY